MTDARTIALDAEIRAWEAAAQHGHIPSGPLCRKYLSSDCAGCPVAEAGFHECEGTSADKACIEDRIADLSGRPSPIGKIRMLAQKHVDFLNGLKRC